MTRIDRGVVLKSRDGIPRPIAPPPGVDLAEEARTARSRFYPVTVAWFTRLEWGAEVAPPTHQLVRWGFLRGLGLIYLAAFVSLWVQIGGLVGSEN